MRAVFPDALAIALLGSIELLLSAVVADGMTGRRHRSNCELVAQGAANIAAVTFGGMCVTGTIARTATNVRAGAHGPVSGMLHALYILLFMLVAAPLAAYIPLACLGVVLAIVAWNMAERQEFAALLRSSWGDAAILLVTFLLTIFDDLTTAIAAGVTLGAFVFLHRMAEAVEVEGGGHLLADDQARFLLARARPTRRVLRTRMFWSIASAARCSSVQPRRLLPYSIASASIRKFSCWISLTCRLSIRAALTRCMRLFRACAAPARRLSSPAHDRRCAAP